MVRQAHLLLGDVEFLEVEDHLLLETVAVDVDLQLCEVIQDACADGLCAGLLEGDDLLFVLLDQVDAAQQVGNQDGPLLCAEGVEVCGGGLRGGEERGVLLVGDRFRFGRDDLGHAQDGRHERVVVGVDARIGERIVQLAEVFAEEFTVDARRGFDALRLDVDEDVDLAALHRAGDQRAQFVFRLPVDGRQAQVEVQLLGIQRADLDRDLFVLKRGFALAEARHGFYHGAEALNFGKFTKNYSKIRSLRARRKIYLRKAWVFGNIFYIFVLVK